MTDPAATDRPPRLTALLTRMAEALETLAGSRVAEAKAAPLQGADAFVWEGAADHFTAVAKVAAVPLELLVGIDLQARTLAENTRRFAQGHAANNALLWGARGMGKSSLVKAVHGAINRDTPGALALVEIHREDLTALPRLLARLRHTPRRVLLFCDDLSFDGQDVSYKALKTVLDGGVEGRPNNVLFYATSNRRHLMPRQMIENEQSTAIHPGESVEEKVSLSDRFGLWLGFHNCDQVTYLAMVDGYADRLGLAVSRDTLHAEAKAWATGRGSRSGRVAWQFTLDLAGRLGRPVTFDDG